MKSRSLDEYVKLGTGLRYLIDIEPGAKVHGPGFVLSNLDGLLDLLDRLGFTVSSRGANEVRALRERLGKLPKEALLTRELREELFEIVNEVYPIVRAEAAGMITFVITDKRVDVNKLLKDVRSLLAPNVFDALPDIAQFDLEEAGKCIAFERPTAAAFHTLRGTEAVLRWMYRAALPAGTLEPMLWHPVVETLRRHSPAPPNELLDNLDNIRRSFRNPTQHPEKIYDIHEAQDLMSLCLDAIGRMVKYVRESAAAA